MERMTAEQYVVNRLQEMEQAVTNCNIKIENFHTVMEGKKREIDKLKAKYDRLINVLKNNVQTTESGAYSLWLAEYKDDYKYFKSVLDEEVEE